MILKFFTIISVYVGPLFNHINLCVFFFVFPYDFITFVVGITMLTKSLNYLVSLLNTHIVIVDL